MKKFLVLMLVLCMASWANAGLINVVADGLGSMGHAGTRDDPLEPSEILKIKIVVADGHWTSAYDLDLHVSGPGALQEHSGGPGATGMPGNHADDGMMGFFWVYTGIENNGIAHMVDASMGSMAGDLVWGLQIHCEGEGEVLVDLTEALLGGTNVDGQVIGEADLGDLIIYQIPEPMTIALLGLGGLLALRRRK